MMPTDMTHHMMEANGIRMHIAEQGTGPTVLLCHGFHGVTRIQDRMLGWDQHEVALGWL